MINITLVRMEERKSFLFPQREREREREQKW
jgi:hypothetical protein